MATRALQTRRLTAMLVGLGGLLSAWSQAADAPTPWEQWATGTWAGYQLQATATNDVLTLNYTVGTAADDWPNAQLALAPPVDLSAPARLVFEVRVSTGGERLPPRFLSVLLATSQGARWQQDMLPVPAVPGQWVTEEIGLLKLPPDFLKSLSLFQFFVWNRDYQNAGLAAGSQVTIEVRQPRLLGIRPERAPSIFQRPPLQRLLGQADGLVVWSEPTDAKLLPEQAPPKVPAGPLEITAAGNEVADFQVALRASRALGPLSLEVDPPHGTDGATAPGVTVQVRLEGLVKTEKPSGFLIRPGLCPDPLLLQSSVSLEPDQTRGFWVNLYVPTGTPAGAYEGDISIRAGEQTLVHSTYRLQVYDFSLPRIPALRTAFQVSVDKGWSHLLDYYPGPDLSLVKALWESLARHRIAPMHLGPGGPPRSAGPAELADFDRYLDLAKELGFNSFGPFMWGPPVDTEEARQWVRQMTDHYASQGVLDRLYVYMCQFDEAGPERYTALREYAAALKQAEPRLPRFITVAPHPDLYGAIDWWCPGTPAYRLDVARERRALGEKVWWYTCVTWSPGLLLDAPGTEHRALLWLTFTQEADGLLFWCLNYWPQNPWETTVMGAGTAGNGDGYLLYPRREGDPTDRVYETVRLEILRDSIEDYDYLTLLKARLAAAATSPVAVAPAAIAAGRTALEAAARIATDATKYSLDPADFAHVRGLVAAAIQGLPKGTEDRGSGRQQP